MSKDDLVVVAGAGGFIGGHLVRACNGVATLVGAVDLKPLDEWYQRLQASKSRSTSPFTTSAEKRPRTRTRSTTSPPTWAAWASSRTTRPLCMLSVSHQHPYAHGRARKPVWSASSTRPSPASTTPTSRHADVTALKEEDAYPAMPEDGYGWEKLFSERMCRHFREDFGMQTRVARYHNVYGPHGT